MLQGIYTSAAGMIAHEAISDVIANNLANVATPGFRQDFATFHMASEQQDAAGRINRAPQLTFQAYTDFRPGGLKPTDSKWDVAFADNGDNFFVVETPKGERYSRAGNFSMDNAGRLVTADMLPVLGLNGYINVKDGTPDITEEGHVLVNGVHAGQLRVVQFDRINGRIPLQKEGYNLFKPISDQTVARVSPHPNLRQGHLEGSNLSMMTQMARLIHIARGFEAYQRSILVSDASLNMLIQRVGGGQ